MREPGESLGKKMIDPQMFSAFLARRKNPSHLRPPPPYKRPEPTQEQYQALYPYHIPQTGMNALIDGDMTLNAAQRIASAAIQCHEKFGNCRYEDLIALGFTQAEIFAQRATVNYLIGMEVYILNNDALRAEGIMTDGHYTADNLDFPAMITFPPEIDALYYRQYPNAPRCRPFKPPPRD